jgi:hypothetical protein
MDYAMLASDCHRFGGALARIQGQKQQRRALQSYNAAGWRCQLDVFEEAIHRNISAQDQYLIAVIFFVDEMIAMSHLRQMLAAPWGQHDCDRRKEATVILTPCQYIWVRKIFVQQ